MIRDALLALLILAVLTGCSDNDTTGPGREIRIDISGVLTPDPVSVALAEAAAPKGRPLSWGLAGDAELRVYEPTDLYVGNRPALGFYPVDPTFCSPSTHECQFRLPDVDIGGLSLGLVAEIRDTRSVPDFAPTVSGLFDAETASQLQQSGEDFAGGIAWAASAKAVAALEALAGASPGQALQYGILFGFMVDAAGRPVEGVRVTPIRDSRMLVHYANDDYTGLQSSTNAAGFFFVLPRYTPTLPVLVSWSATGGGESWPDLSDVVTLPGAAAVLVWSATS